MDAPPDLIAEMQQRIVWLEQRVAALEAAAGGPSIAPMATRPSHVPTHVASADPLEPSAEVVELVQRGLKIQAIRRYREQTGLGLKESKKRVEAIRFR